MSEAETTNEFTDRVMKIVNHVGMLGKERMGKRLVEKLLVSLLEKFEAKFPLSESQRIFPR